MQYAGKEREVFMRRRITAIVAALMMVLSLAACGDSGNSGGNTAQTTPATGTGSTAKTAEKTEEPKSEPVDIYYIARTGGNSPTDLQMVLDNFNEKYAIPLTNTRLHMDLMNVGAFIQQANIMLSSGEEFDAFQMFAMSMPTLVAQGQIQSLTSALNEYGKDLLQIIPETTMKGNTINGEIYGIGNVDRSMGSAQGIYYRLDLVEKYGFDESRLTDISYLEECLQVIKDNEPEIQYPLLANNAYYPYIGNLVPNEDYSSFDANSPALGAVLEQEEGWTVYNQYATDKFMTITKKLHEWYEKGFLNQNASITNDDETQNYFRNGLAFAYFNMYYPDTIATLTTTYPGLRIGAQPMIYNYSGTGDYQIFALCVPTASKKVNDVVKLWNMLYTNTDAVNALCYGIEGTHFEKTGKDDREIRYPNGLDSTTSPFPFIANATLGQYYLGYYQEGTPSNMKELTEEFNQHVPMSKLVGFSFDGSEINSDIAAVNAVVDQYYQTIANGAVDPEVEIPKFLDALEQAGAAKCRAEFQKQLEAWNGGN